MEAPVKLTTSGRVKLTTSFAAPSPALQNSLGLICDPIGNRVEAPCLGRNVMAATNAVSCANNRSGNSTRLIVLVIINV